MLNKPAQNATETESPVNTSSAALAADSPQGRVRAVQLPSWKKAGRSPRPPQVICRKASAATEKSERLMAIAAKQTKRGSATAKSEGSARPAAGGTARRRAGR